MVLLDALESVVDRATFVNFVRLLCEQVERGEVDVANNSLARYFDGMAAWVDGMDGYYCNMGVEFSDEKLSWRHVADIVYAALIYE